MIASQYLIKAPAFYCGGEGKKKRCLFIIPPLCPTSLFELGFITIPAGDENSCFILPRLNYRWDLESHYSCLLPESLGLQRPLVISCFLPLTAGRQSSEGPTDPMCVALGALWGETKTRWPSSELPPHLLSHLRLSWGSAGSDRRMMLAGDCCLCGACCRPYFSPWLLHPRQRRKQSPPG